MYISPQLEPFLTLQKGMQCGRSAAFLHLYAHSLLPPALLSLRCSCNTNESCCTCMNISACTYGCVCVWVRVHMCVCVHKHTLARPCLNTHTHAHTYSNVHSRTHTRTRTIAHAHACTRARTNKEGTHPEWHAYDYWSTVYFLPPFTPHTHTHTRTRTHPHVHTHTRRTYTA